MPLVLKITDDKYNTFSKEFEQKKDGIQIEFKMNEFGNEPLSSMSQGGDLTIGTGDDTPSPFAGFA